tara:strand:- start:512 stop:709 length:198 start_codon:yes stop_codon:yes gene_type:complete
MPGILKSKEWQLWLILGMIFLKENYPFQNLEDAFLKMLKAILGIRRSVENLKILKSKTLHDLSCL